MLHESCRKMPAHQRFVSVMISVSHKVLFVFVFVSVLVFVCFIHVSISVRPSPISISIHPYRYSYLHFHTFVPLSPYLRMCVSPTQHAHIIDAAMSALMNKTFLLLVYGLACGQVRANETDQRTTRLQTLGSRSFGSASWAKASKTCRTPPAAISPWSSSKRSASSSS